MPRSDAVRGKSAGRGISLNPRRAPHSTRFAAGGPPAEVAMTLQTRVSVSGKRRDESSMDTRPQTIACGSAVGGIRRNRALWNILLFAVLVTLTACEWRIHPELSVFGGGSGTEDDPFLISTEEQLRGISAANMLLDGKHLRLTADIRLSSPWTPIGRDYHSFGGIFDGGGHTISQLAIHDADLDNVGLFGFVNHYGAVRNLTVETSAEGIAVAQQRANVGIIVGYNLGQIENCTARGLVKAGSVIGGIVGTNRGIVRNCTNCATIDVKDPAGQAAGLSGGGIAGSNTTENAVFKDVLLSGCQNKGRVTVNGGGHVRVGGIAAYSGGSARIEDCSNDAAVSASAGNAHAGGSQVYAGGVVGELDSGTTAMRCINRSSVRATGQAKACAGGVAGQIAGAKLIQCRSKDAVTAKGNPARRGIVAGSAQPDAGIIDCGKLP